ncbi:hypothetical protein [Endozoicomonas atrinae]|uniref:hypothetical protein n=1 Tax=Endozoicomonas atrinae TaxID=1333660 RepID=UPI003B008D24
MLAEEAKACFSPWSTCWLHSSLEFEKSQEENQIVFEHGLRRPELSFLPVPPQSESARFRMMDGYFAVDIDNYLVFTGAVQDSINNHRNRHPSPGELRFLSLAISDLACSLESVDDSSKLERIDQYLWVFNKMINHFLGEYPVVRAFFLDVNPRKPSKIDFIIGLNLADNQISYELLRLPSIGHDLERIKNKILMGCIVAHSGERERSFWSIVNTFTPLSIASFNF